MSKLKLMSTVAASCIGLCLSGMEAARADAPLLADTGAPVLDEVIVTAQKRGENLQDVPVAVTALSGTALQAAGASTIDDVNNLASGLEIQSPNGYVQAHIRGVGTTAVGAGLENSVAVYVDGIYVASMPGSLMSLYDVSQVEVLKGPQGTLFGRNATGGLIQVTSTPPSQQFSAHADVGYANYDTVTANAYASGGITSDLAASLAAHVSTQGTGWGENLVSGKPVYQTDSDVAARGKLLFAPSDQTSISLGFDYVERRGTDASSSREVTGMKPLFGPAFSGGDYDIASGITPLDALHAGGVTAHIEHQFDFATLTSITGYRRSDYDLRFDAAFTPTPVLGVDNNLADNQVTEEVQLASLDRSKIKWIVGLFYFDDNSSYQPTITSFGGPLVSPVTHLAGLVTEATQSTKSYAGYGQVTIPLFDDKTHFTAGGRYTAEHRDLVSATDGLLTGGIPIGPLGAPITEDKDYYKATWRFALDRELAEGQLAYVSVNRGFKSGGFNAGIPTDAPFAPEVLDAYEVGYKSELFDKRLRFNIAAFDYEYSNIQVSKFEGGQISYYNGASARTYGTDMDIEASLDNSLKVTGGVSLLHDRFLSFPDAVTIVPLPMGGGAPLVESASGNRLPITPDATFNLNLLYHRETEIGGFSVNGSYYYNSGYFAQPDNTLNQKAYHQVGANVEWREPDGRYAVNLWGRNLTDARVVTSLAASPQSAILQYQAPRTFGVTLSADF